MGGWGTVRARRRWTVGLLLLAVSACGDASERAATGDAESLRFPAPEPVAGPTVAREDFAGAEACASCHAEQYQAWSGSTHGRAGGPPGPDVVIAPFDGRAIRFADATVTPRVRGGTYEFVVRQDGFEESVHRVDGVIGRAHMIGGGTQGFISRQPDGTERFLPWDWSGSASTWFCNTGSRTNEGWEPIRIDMRLADCGDWPPVRPIGTVDRFANCQECHGSQISTELAPGEGYTTQHTTLQINCESCHGPAARHVALATSAVERGGPGPGDELGIESLAYLPKDEALAVCFQCHALKDVLEEGYLPGESLEAYYALKYPVLGDQPYFADGRVRSFAYQGNHLASACYLLGPMDCASCHEPHGQGYWDIERNPLSDPYDDGQCTSCHPSKLVDPEAHTFHPAESDGARCVSCHMPYLQHPEVGDGVPFARSDHTIAVPRPVFDADLGIVGACAQCHDDRSPLQLQTQVRELWGDPKPHRPLIAGMVSELRARNLAEAGDLLLRPDETDPLVQFQAMARLLTGYLRADMDSLPATVEERLLELTTSEDLDVRSLAAAALHWSRGDDPDVRRRLVGMLRDAPADELLRRRWVLALGFLGDHARDGEQFAESAAAYRKALELRPNDPRVLHALGRMHARAGDHAAAVDAIRASLAADEAQPLAWVNLGLALSNDGDPGGAHEAFEQALRINPHEALAHFNLGNLHQAAGRHAEAAEAYADAVAADPGLGLAHFELGRTYIRLERFEDALHHARRAVEFLPDDTLARQMLSDLERALGA